MKRNQLSAADKAWGDYMRSIRAMYPYSEARKIEAAMRPAHEARWARIDAAKARTPWRGVCEADIDG